MPRPAPIILIAGPTASGKSALAIAIARRLGGTIVNADSMQVYAELRILTARPTPEEEREAPHRLFGHVPAATAYSAGRWLADVAPLLAGDGPVVIVGGTGLYLKALTEGLSEIPPIPAAIRQHWRGEAARLPADVLHALLAARDPATAARLRASDPQRIVRALEVLEATGRPLAAWQTEPRRPLLGQGRWRGLILAPERHDLRARIDARFDRMMAEGALEEARHLAALRLDPGLPAMRALGVPPLIAHLEGRITLVEAVERAKAETRRYAKRQATWLRHQLEGPWRTVRAGEEVDMASLLPATNGHDK